MTLGETKLAIDVMILANGDDCTLQLKTVKEMLDAIMTSIEQVNEQSYKRGFKEAEKYYRQENIDELTALLSNVPMPILSYEQVEHRLAIIKKQQDA